MVTVELIQKHHLKVVLPWWPARGMDAPPEWLLPPAGFVAIDEAGPCAAAWLALTDGVPVGRVEWLIARPGLSTGNVRAACRVVVDAIESAARAKSLKALFACSYRHQMMRDIEACGFVETVAGVTHFAKGL